MLSLMRHLVLIDGHHMMYRAYWAIPRTLRTSAGEQVNTIFGMASMLLAILQTEQPDNMVVCFDDGDQTFRHQENETYKDGRAETPDDFYEQIPRVFELMQAFSLSQASNPTYEADDLIASYAMAAIAEGMRVTIVSGDKDLLQLASEHIRIAIPHKGYQAVEYLGPVETEGKMGVRPDQIAAYKGLCGDSSDNLPGVKGIGPKTAASLLQQYDTLENLYDHIDEVKGSAKEKLVNDQEQAFFCQRMAVLVDDAELPTPLTETALESLPASNILNMFRELEFTLLTKRFVSLLDTEYGKNHFASDEMELLKFSQEKKSEDQMTLFS